MTRYWIGHALASAGIAGAGLGIGALFNYVGNQGSVPYLNDAARFMGTAFQLGGLGGAAAYFGLGIPHVLDRERDLGRRNRLNEIEGIGLDTAGINARNDRLAALWRYLQNLQGPNQPQQGP